MSAADYRERRNQITTTINRQLQVLVTIPNRYQDPQQRMLARTAYMEIKRQIAQARMLRPPSCYASHREVELRHLDTLEQAADDALASFQAADDGKLEEFNA